MKSNFNIGMLSIGNPIIEDKFLEVPETTIREVRFKGRGIVCHRRVTTWVPDPNIYKSGDYLIMHPQTAAKIRATVEKLARIQEAAAVISGVPDQWHP